MTATDRALVQDQALVVDGVELGADEDVAVGGEHAFRVGRSDDSPPIVLTRQH